MTLTRDHYYKCYDINRAQAALQMEKPLTQMQIEGLKLVMLIRI